MTRFKGITCLAMCLVFIFSLTGCRGGGTKLEDKYRGRYYNDNDGSIIWIDVSRLNFESLSSYGDTVGYLYKKGSNGKYSRYMHNYPINQIQRTLGVQNKEVYVYQDYKSVSGGYDIYIYSDKSNTNYFKFTITEKNKKFYVNFDGIKGTFVKR